MRLGSLGSEGWGLLIAAPAIGSFIGVVIRRLPYGHPIIWSRSKCEGCGTVLSPRDLLPLISWVIARGRCRHCGCPLGWFYPGVEIAALIVALSALLVDDMPRAALDCLLGWWLLALAWIDWQRMRLPDLLTLPLLAVGLAATALEMPDELTASVIGVVVGYAALRLVDLGYRGLRGREGLGQGDAKLLAVGGAWLGWEALSWVVLLAAVLGLALAVFQRACGVTLTRDTALPFGPPLALAIWIVRLYGFPGS